MTDAGIIERIIADEGGDRITDNPADPGGVTKFGITLPALKDYALDRGFSDTPTADTIRSLTHEVAVDFYANLLARTKIGQIPNEVVRYTVFDAAVHMGARQAVKLLQRALGTKDDGVIGVATLAAIPHLNGRLLALAFCCEQMKFYGRLAAKNLTDADKDGTPDQLEFLPGYLNRLANKMLEVAK